MCVFVFNIDESLRLIARRAGKNVLRDEFCPEPKPGQLVLMNCQKAKLKREGRSFSPIGGYVAPKRNKAEQADGTARSSSLPAQSAR